MRIHTGGNVKVIPIVELTGIGFLYIVSGIIPVEISRGVDAHGSGLFCRVIYLLVAAYYFPALGNHFIDFFPRAKAYKIILKEGLRDCLSRISGHNECQDYSALSIGSHGMGF